MCEGGDRNIYVAAEDLGEGCPVFVGTDGGVYKTTTKAPNPEAVKSKSNDGLNAEEIKRQERARVWHEINKKIKTGKLQGNGCDETATRNGLVLATNIVSDMGI